MVPPVRHTLLTKALQTAPTGGPSVTNPATLSRPEHVQMDEGRPWAGDLYDYGVVTDPEQSFAAFGDQADGDVVAWLDKGDDGVLIGWVQDGENVYRYSDPEAWSIDVDGAGLLRTDGGAATMEGEAVPTGAGDDLAAEGEEMLADASTADTSIGDADPTAFEEEDDEALLEGDPTEALEDPTDPLVEDATGDGGPDAQGAFADMLTDDTLPTTDPTADPAAAAEEDPDAEPLEHEEGEEQVTATGVPAAIPPAPEPAEAAPAPEPTEEPEGEEPAHDDAPDAAEPTDMEDPDEVLTIAPEDLPTADDDDEDPDAEDEDDEDDEDEEGKKNRPFERKHFRGDHNQDTHGRRYSIGARTPRARTSGNSATSGDSPTGSASTTGGVAAKPAPAAGKRITLSERSIASMSEKDLDAVMHDGNVYDDDTMMRAAVEYDKRKPLDDAWAKNFDATEPGSVEEHKMRREVIPSEWLAWAAAPSRKPKRSVMAQREDEWLSFIQAQYLAALDATNGQFFSARYRGKPPFGEMAFFDGTAGVQQARKYMSPELKEWWDTHGVTKSEFMAEFSDKAKARQANTKRDDLHA